ncbi:MAG: hypothetical protein R3302_05940 [Sulfurimonadaceae bacterium]|nr:hypothetical protein [Sulfurimonadaceae bacterium]
MKFLLLLLPLLLTAETLMVGDVITPIDFPDQREKQHTVGHESVWVVTWDKMTTRHANLLFQAKPQLLREGQVAMIVDVSQTPSGIMNLFVLPRMRSYKHRILLGYDAAYNRSIPYSDGAITVLYLSDGKVLEVAYAEDGEALEKLLTD